MRRVLWTLGIAYVAWLVIVYFAQDALLFPRWMTNSRYAPAPNGVETWDLKHADGVRTQACFFAARSGIDARPTIVLLHGNAMLVQDWDEWARSLSNEGWNVLLPEFRGYGASEGTPSREALVSDLVDAMERLTADPRVDPSKIVLYGRSIGGAVAAEAAARLRVPPAGLILHTTPARLSEFAWRYGVPPLLMRNPFDAEGAVRELRSRCDAECCTIIVIGHHHDEIVPSAHAIRLAQAAGVNVIEVDGTHNGYESAAAERDAATAIESALRTVRDRSW